MFFAVKLVKEKYKANDNISHLQSEHNASGGIENRESQSGCANPRYCVKVVFFVFVIAHRYRVGNVNLR